MEPRVPDPIELDPLGEPRLRAAATIGVFDGVHRGHRELLDRVRRAAADAGVASLVITFDPHPIQVFAPTARPHRIASREVSRRLFREAGIDRVWFLGFSREMAGWSPAAFLDHLLARVEPTSLWIGYDFRFGRDRAGDFGFLQRAGERAGFAVQRVRALELEGRPISSTWVRERLRSGDVEGANALLGHPFELEGPVVHGQGLGARELVATANLDLPHEQLLPRRGIYAGWADDPHGRWSAGPIPAAINIGCRPTIGGGGEDWVEVHLIDWEGDIYGERLSLRLTHWIRPEETFPDLESLRRAIDHDLAVIRTRLGREERGGGPRPEVSAEVD